jgi:hypothetical protein
MTKPIRTVIDASSVVVMRVCSIWYGVVPAGHHLASGRSRLPDSDPQSAVDETGEPPRAPSSSTRPKSAADGRSRLPPGRSGQRSAEDDADEEGELPARLPPAPGRSWLPDSGPQCHIRFSRTCVDGVTRVHVRSTRARRCLLTVFVDGVCLLRLLACLLHSLRLLCSLLSLLLLLSWLRLLRLL